MNSAERQHIHSLFESKDYLEIYKTQEAVIKEMLFIEEQAEFEDFLDDEDFLDEDIFWLYHSATEGESLLIGGYEEDVTEKVTAFLSKKLPLTVFENVKNCLSDLYVDLGTRDTLEEKIGICNGQLADTDYLLKLDFEYTYCDGAYFLSVISQK